MDNFNEFLNKFSQAFSSHLHSSFNDAIVIIPVIVILVASIYIIIKIWNKAKMRRYYDNIFADICNIQGLSIEEKIKLYCLSKMAKVKHPIFFLIQSKRWQQFLHDPEASYLYRKLFS